MPLEPRLRLAINTMAVSIARILADAQPSIYLYGSITTEDYRHGWSDIDLLVLTREPITEAQADALLHLRQTLAARDPDTPYYRLFEGGMLDLDEVATTAFVLDMDTKNLCSEDCKGLCGRCGADLNLGPCTCKSDVDPRLAALAQLLDDES